MTEGWRKFDSGRGRSTEGKWNDAATTLATSIGDANDRRPRVRPGSPTAGPADVDAAGSRSVVDIYCPERSKQRAELCVPAAAASICLSVTYAISTSTSSSFRSERSVLPREPTGRLRRLMGGGRTRTAVRDGRSGDGRLRGGRVYLDGRGRGALGTRCPPERSLSDYRQRRPVTGGSRDTVSSLD